jgi:hypothetical protein
MNQKQSPELWRRGASEIAQLGQRVISDINREREFAQADIGAALIVLGLLASMGSLS